MGHVSVECEGGVCVCVCVCVHLHLHVRMHEANTQPTVTHTHTHIHTHTNTHAHTVYAGQQVRILGENYTLEDEEDSKIGQVTCHPVDPWTIRSHGGSCLKPNV